VQGRIDLTAPGGGLSSKIERGPVCWGDGERRDLGSMKRMLAGHELLYQTKSMGTHTCDKGYNETESAALQRLSEVIQSENVFKT